MKQTKQFLRPLLMAIVMMVGMLVPQGAWAEELDVDYGETKTIDSDASYDIINVYPGGELIINEGVTLTVTERLNIQGTVINYGTIIGMSFINMCGGVLANHGNIYVDVDGIGTFYNTGTLVDASFYLTPIECNHDDSEYLGTVEATCTHGAGTQFKCNKCYYIGIDETGEPKPHDNHDHNGLKVCSVCGQLTFDATPVGEGTAESPYQIANAGHLFWFADKVNNDYDNFKDANAVLTADIVVNDGTFAANGAFTATGASEPSTPIEWLIIARFVTYSHGYRGTFNGQGHTISGLYANYTNSGLVGMSSGECKIKNVGVINSYFASIEYVGGICGDADDNTEISNCYSSNVICKGNYVGGILGWAACSGVSIVNCYSTASLIGVVDWAHFGGIAAQSVSTTNCYTTYGNATEWSESEINCEANVSLERFASGEIAYKLNGSVDGEGHWTAGATDGTQAWYQKLGENGDSYPVLAAAEGNTVYYGYEDCLSESETYSNNLRYAEKEDSHDYKVLLDEDNNPVFVWSEGYTTATLQVVCSNNEEHTANVVVTGEGITSAETTPATCTTAGMRTYTATATYEGVEYTGVKEVEIPALGHQFGEDQICTVCGMYQTLSLGENTIDIAGGYEGSIFQFTAPEDAAYCFETKGDRFILGVLFSSEHEQLLGDFSYSGDGGNFRFYKTLEAGSTVYVLVLADDYTEVNDYTFVISLHDHTWDGCVCTVCGEDRHQWISGVCETCRTHCEHDWKSGVCKVCGSVCEHIWVDEEFPPSCTVDGYSEKTCQYCDTKITKEIPALGHSFTNKIMTPVPDEHGLYAYVCEREGCEEHSDYNVVKDGEAFSTSVEFTIPSDQVTVERTFTASKPATVMLPFTIDASLVQGATFHEFKGVAYDSEKAQWVATMTSVSTTLQAYKPYIVILDAGNATGKVTFGNNTSADVATFVVTPDASTMKTADENGWTFQAVNAAKTWAEGDKEIGKAYGFAGKDKTVDGNVIHQGDFVKIDAGASAKPGRCYLVKDGTLSGVSNAPARAAAEELPATIAVRFINGETLGIGTLNTETGEMSIDGWYDLQGNRIEQPTKGGINIHNNKKILVK